MATDFARIQGMDGSVRLIANSIDRAIWQSLSTRDGGETVTLP